MYVKLETITPSFHKVEVDRVILWFSYSELIAFYTDESGLVVSENLWWRTTGGHIAKVSKDAPRTGRKQFMELFEKHTGGKLS